MSSTTAYRPINPVVEDGIVEPEQKPASSPKVYSVDDSSSDLTSSEGLHLEARTLESEWVAALLAWTWDVFLTALPLFYIVLPILVLRLQGEQISEYGSQIMEITRLSPTIYPILFTIITARFYKNLARWNLERPRGIQLSSLEQIIGSQSFGSAIERFVVVRAWLLIRLLILFTWLLSPIGGQSSSRLLHVETKTMFREVDVYYSHTDHQMSAFGGGSMYSDTQPIVETIYAASLLSTPKQQRTFSDLWNRPKIPMWPRSGLDAPTGTWREVDADALTAGDDYYTALVGVPIQGLRFDDQTTEYNFSVQSSYVDLDCSLSQKFDTVDKTKIYLNNSLSGGQNADQGNLTEKLRKSSFAVYLSSYPLTVTPLKFLHVSRANSGGNYGMYVFECGMRAVNLETNIRCTTRDCTPFRQRLRPNPRSSDQPLPGNMYSTPLYNLFRILPNMAGESRADKASPTENWIANDTTVYSTKDWRDWDGTDMAEFSTRYTVLLNTAWQASLDPAAISNTSLTSTPVLDPSRLSHYGSVVPNRTAAVVTNQRRVYQANLSWVATLVLVTAVLQVLALAGLGLQCLIRGPDVLGFASSLTRDNRFVPLSGGSALGGAERTRAVGDMRVRLADVRPGEGTGYIALSALPVTGEGGDSGAKEKPRWRALEKRRMYD